MGKKTTTNNTSTASEGSNTEVPITELIKQYVKHPNGAIFHVLTHPKKIGYVYLNAKNGYQEFPLADIRNGFVSGAWLHVNEHELRKHLKMEKLYQEQFTYRLVKRILLTQLLLELDDELKADFENDKYIHGLLERCEKQFERLVTEQYTKFYEIDKQMVQNFLKHIEDFVGKAAKLGVHEFYHVVQMMDLYLADPEKFQSELVYLEKIDA